jgi:hypothetical protein
LERKSEKKNKPLSIVFSSTTAFVKGKIVTNQCELNEISAIDTHQQSKTTIFVLITQ